MNKSFEYISITDVIEILTLVYNENRDMSSLYFIMSPSSFRLIEFYRNLGPIFKILAIL